MAKILVTGGCGYIGSHTLVDLIEHGYDVISIDDLSRSSLSALTGVEMITGKKVKNYKVDLKNFDETLAVFQEHPDISGVIHFAAYKAVGESVGNPLLYYENNLLSLISLLKCVKEFDIPHIVFSSSCTVYGNPDHIPVTETTPIQPAASPYGATKQMGEEIVRNLADSSDVKAVLLRYFNPVGAHPSALIGEMPLGKPQNLVPAITQTAAGKLPMMMVYGNDYPTRDGSCIRDYIHVCDIARAHTLALQYLASGKQQTPTEVFNLGTGNCITVLEAIHSFEAVSGVSLNYTIGSRRDGDIVAIYANNEKALQTLGWSIQYDLHAMMRTAWAWECRIQETEKQARNN